MSQIVAAQVVLTSPDAPVIVEGPRTNGFMGLPEINEPYRYHNLAVH